MGRYGLEISKKKSLLKSAVDLTVNQREGLPKDNGARKI